MIWLRRKRIDSVRPMSNSDFEKRKTKVWLPFHCARRRTERPDGTRTKMAAADGRWTPNADRHAVDIHTRTRNFCKLCTSRATIPGVRVKHFLYPLGTSVSSVRPCHNTRNFCEFCNKSMPVPETSGSSVRLPYPYPESTNPTEHNLENLHTCFKVSLPNP